MTEAELSRTTAPWFTLAAWAGGVVATAWVLWGPYLVFAYLNPSARLVTETVVLCVALLGAYLAHGRFMRGKRVQDLLLAQGLILVAMACAPVSAAVARALPGAPGATDVWLSATLHVVGFALLLGAALAGRARTLPRATQLSGRWLTPLIPALVLGVLLLIFTLIGDTVSLAVDPAYHPIEEHPALLTAHPLLIATQLVSGLCLLGASVIWTAQAASSNDVLLRWLGPACALGGLARLLFALTPSLYTNWFYVGDIMRLGMYLLLLVGSGRELSQYWTARTTGAVLADRRRLAGELHDGVIQELVYIRGESHSLDSDPELRDRLINATDRAIDEARAAIHALTHLNGEPFMTLLQRTAKELGRRHGIHIEVEADEQVEVHPEQLHTLLRIVREAITNAARHGHADTVRIEFTAEDGARVLRVRDNGEGFDPQSVGREGSGYGLVSMAERAQSLTGTLEIDSTVGQGSEVRVTW